MTRGSSRARQPLSRVNLTGFTMPTSGKNRKYLCIQKKIENIFKNWLCPNFSSCPKNSSYPKSWGGCSPPRPPGPYAYAADADREINISWHDNSQSIFLEDREKLQLVAAV